MAKKDAKKEVIDIRRAPLKIAVRCGGCMFLNKAGAYSDRDSCASFGTVASSDPCRWYTPDPRKLQSGDLSFGEMLAELVSCRNPHSMAAALVSRGRVRRMGFDLGEEVYFHVMSGDYICNYSAGRVIGAIHDLIIIEGVGCTALYKPENLMHLADWGAKLGRLLKAKKVNDPEGGLRRLGKGPEAKLVKYLPPYLKSNKAVKIPKRGKKPKGNVIVLS